MRIAAKLEITVRTVDHLIEKAVARLKAKNITQACVEALRNRILPEAPATPRRASDHACGSYNIHAVDA
jgi:hypothetical protein